MKTALIFPGQGSQAVGMGKALAEAFAASREVFERVDAALGEKLSRLIFEGPEAELTLTANAQPALMATSLAALRALEAVAGARCRPRRGVRRRPLARRIFRARRGGLAFDRRRGAAAAHPRPGDAEGGSGRRGRDGGHPRARIPRRRRDRRRRIARNSWRRLRGGERQRRRPGRRLRRQSCGMARHGARPANGRQARAAAAGLRPLPLRADAARRRGDARRARRRAIESAESAAGRQFFRASRSPIPRRSNRAWSTR